MEKLIALERLIVPEMGELMYLRYLILRHIYFSQPVGRRTLAADLDLQERLVRREVEILRRQGLIVVSNLGILITEEGKSLLWEIEEYVRHFRGLSQLEEQLKQSINVKDVYVVAGDVDSNPTVIKTLARQAVQVLLDHLQEGDILAISGGTTMAEVAAALPHSGKQRDVLVIPARGGLTENVEIQANTVAAAIANNLGGRYRLFHLPDGLEKDMLEKLLSEPTIREHLDLIQRAHVVIHGIGTAENMAKRRGFGENVMAELKAKGAVGEVFGYYYDSHGHVVHAASSAGLQIDNLDGKEVIAVAGGKQKASAILAATLLIPGQILVLDEGVAAQIVELL
ncbi:MAG: sugar-binding transcriptional regulator [Bacillota bacterium]